MKTYHQLTEASQLLTADTGEVKSFEKFFQDVQKINEAYNRRYLEAEYGFAVHSAQMAVRWNDYEQDGDAYNLQYRTAGDDRVRADHAALNGTTLPMNDPFWTSYTPPLDWGCRCTIIQVLKHKYPVSDSPRAQELGKEATTRIGADGSNKLAMFRFNPGTALKIFPDKHPYFPRGCDNCQKNMQLASAAGKNELCAVCAIVRKQAKKSATAHERNKYLAEMQPLLKQTLTKETDGKQITVKFTKKGNNHLYSDTFKRAKGVLLKKDLKNLNTALQNAVFVKPAELSKKRKDNIVKFYYFKDKDKELYYNVAEEVRKGKVIRYLYSATTHIQ
ncbi:MAG: minor capsid protein [Prevotellaceae bacterium]|jgi:SPP1 gp7 family putative phage head morphogenesis protein|nr:minor capsid protein [Prevotellaceae bacterium]